MSAERRPRTLALLERESDALLPLGAACAALALLELLFVPAGRFADPARWGPLVAGGALVGLWVALARPGPRSRWLAGAGAGVAFALAVELAGGAWGGSRRAETAEAWRAIDRDLRGAASAMAEQEVEAQRRRLYDTARAGDLEATLNAVVAHDVGAERTRRVMARYRELASDELARARGAREVVPILETAARHEMTELAAEARARYLALAPRALDAADPGDIVWMTDVARRLELGSDHEAAVAARIAALTREAAARAERPAAVERLLDLTTDLRADVDADLRAELAARYVALATPVVAAAQTTAELDPHMRVVLRHDLGAAFAAEARARYVALASRELAAARTTDELEPLMSAARAYDLGDEFLARIERRRAQLER